MRTLTSLLAAHVAGEVTTLTVCWMVLRKDGEIVRGTQHDRNVVINTGLFAGTYPTVAGITASDIHSGSDLSPDNSEVDGALTDNAFITDLKSSDIEAGLYDDAEVSLFMCNWAAPNDGQIQLPGANLGNIRRLSEGRYTAELRGLVQRLSQPLLRTYSVSCNADLGDARCGKDISALIATASVLSVVSRRRFDVDLDSSAGEAGDFLYGKVVGITGQNAGYVGQVKRDAVGAVFGNLELYEMLPLPVSIGDTFNLYPGCDKTLATCRDRFNNVLSFRGFGVFTPTANKMIRGPDRGSGPV